MDDILKKCGDKAYDIGVKANSVQDYAMAIAATINIFSNTITGVVDNLRTEVARAGADIAVKINSGFDTVYQGALNDFTQLLIRSAGFQGAKKAYENALHDLKLKYPDIDEAKIKSPPRNTEQDWVILAAIAFASLLAEGILGATLLGEHMRGGMLAAMGFAIAISMLNVVGLGMGMGALFDHIHRKKVIPVWWFTLWFILVLTINGVIAWYRYNQIPQKETLKGAAISPELAMFLFALLGVFFACVAFWRIYKQWEPEYLLHAQWKKLDDTRKSYLDDVNKIFSKRQNEMNDVKQDVVNFYQRLTGLLFVADNQWQGLKMVYDVAPQIINGEFRRGYCSTRPGIDLEPEDLPTGIHLPEWENWTKAFRSRDAAREILEKWNSDQMKSFADRHKEMLSELSNVSANTSKKIGAGGIPMPTVDQPTSNDGDGSKGTQADSFSDNNQQA